MKHEGFELWSKVMDGDPVAQKNMEKYCAQDVRVLEALYKKMRPYIKNHPHVDMRKVGACPTCGSTHVHSRGYRRTRCFAVQRLHCQNCGAWSAGTRRKIK